MKWSGRNARISTDKLRLRPACDSVTLPVADIVCTAASAASPPSPALMAESTASGSAACAPPVPAHASTRAHIHPAFLDALCIGGLPRHRTIAPERHHPAGLMF